MRDMDVGSRFAAPDSRQTLTFVLVAIIFPANQINIFDLYYSQQLQAKCVCGGTKFQNGAQQVVTLRFH